MAEWWEVERIVSDGDRCQPWKMLQTEKYEPISKLLG